MFYQSCWLYRWQQARGKWLKLLILSIHCLKFYLVQSKWIPLNMPHWCHILLMIACVFHQSVYHRLVLAFSEQVLLVWIPFRPKHTTHRTAKFFKRNCGNCCPIKTVKLSKKSLQLWQKFVACVELEKQHILCSLVRSVRGPLHT